MKNLNLLFNLLLFPFLFLMRFSLSRKHSMHPKGTSSPVVGTHSRRRRWELGKRWMLSMAMFALLLTSPVQVHAVDIYAENFSGQNDKGAIGSSTNTAGVTWTIDVSSTTLSNTNDWFAVKSEAFDGRDLDDAAIWYSPSIDISAYENVSFSLDASKSGGTMESSDYVDIYYSIDGGAYTMIPNWNSSGDGSHTLIDDFSPQNITQSIGTASSLQIKVIMKNDGRGERYKFDNVLVTDSDPTTPPLPGDQYSCGMFSKVLVTYDHLDLAGMNITANTEVCGTPSIAYPDGELTTTSSQGETLPCVETCGGSTEGSPCNRVDPPANMLDYSWTHPGGGSALVSGTLTDPVYESNTGLTGDVTFRAPEQDGTKYMYIGDIGNGNSGVTLYFSGGDYYFNSMTGKSNKALNIARDPADTSGVPVRIFIAGNLALPSNNAGINQTGSSSNIDFFIYVGGNFDYGNSGGGTIEVKAYIYVEGYAKVKPNTQNFTYTGGLTAEGRLTIDGNNVNFVQPSDDNGFGYGACQMCYTDIYVGGMSFGFGDCPGFSMSFMSHITVPIESSERVSNVTVEEGHVASMFSMSFMESYQVNDQDGNKVRNANTQSTGFSAGAMGMDMSIYGSKVVSYPLGDGSGYGPAGAFGNSSEYQSLRSSSMMGFDFCSWRESVAYVAHYDDGDRHYDVQLEQCTEAAPCVDIQWQDNSYSISEDYENPMPSSKTVYTVIELPGGPVGFDTNVTYATVDSTAIGGSNCPNSGIYDYISKSGTVTILAGESNVTVPIEVCNDSPIELDEHFFVNLSYPQPVGYVCLNDHNRTKIIISAQENSPICFEDDFGDGSGELDSLWRVLSNPNAINSYTPQMVSVNGDGRLRLTDDTKNLSTVITKDYTFDTRLNLIIVEFDYYAYGGCSGGGLGNYGADGIVSTLFDSTIGDTPVPGGRGGSMGYAQIIDSSGNQDGFQGGWLGLGIDEYGNYSNPTEGREEGPGFRTNAVAIRGDGSGTSGYEYLEGTDALTPVLAQKTGYESDGYFSGRYKMTIDARDPAHLWLKLERDIDGNESSTHQYQVIIDQFDAKDSQYGQGTTPTEVRYAISAGTGGGCNNHELSYIQLRGNCEIYAVEDNYISGPFAALDDYRWLNDAPKDPNDKSISTKDANAPTGEDGAIDLIIASMNAAGDSSETKENIDVKFGIYSAAKNQNECGGEDYCSRSTIRDFNASTVAHFNTDFTVLEAYSNMHVRIFYCGDYDTTSNLTTLYPLSDCGITDNNPTSFIDARTERTSGSHLFYHVSDHFAVKPSSFFVDADLGPHKAGEDLNVIFEARDTDDNPTLLFSETAGGTFLVDINESDPDGCIVGAFENVNLLNDWSFADGNATVLTRYKEVGNISIKIFDTNLSCTERYARIDCDDKNVSGWNTDTDTAIGEATISGVEFIPDHFEVVATLKDHHVAPGIKFTYLSANHIDMAATLDLNITAKTADDDTTTNYNENCYAKTVDLDIDIAYSSDPTTPNALPDILYEIKAADSTTFTTIDSSSNNINHINEDDLANNIFASTGDHNGTAELTIKINFERKNNEVVNPFEMNITDINVTDNTHISGIIVYDEPGINAPDSNATFYYARTRASQFFYDDVTDLSIGTPISINIFCDFADFDDCRDMGIKTDTGATNEAYWWLSMDHRENSTQNDGNVTLQVGTTNPSGEAATVTPTNIQITSGGIDSSVRVATTSSARPLIVPIELVNRVDSSSEGYDAFATPYTNSWLIYHSNKDEVPDPFYKVRFIGQEGWAGHGDTGNVVDSNASFKKNRRLSW